MLIKLYNCAMYKYKKKSCVCRIQKIQIKKNLWIYYSSYDKR